MYAYDSTPVLVSKRPRNCSHLVSYLMTPFDMFLLASTLSIMSKYFHVSKYPTISRSLIVFWSKKDSYILIN